MIVRIWHGKTKLKDRERYLDFLLTKGTQEYRLTEGNQMIKIWEKPEPDNCSFWTVTEWKDIASIKAFAGDDHDKAKYYPEDKGFLLEFEEHVEHYNAYDVSQYKIQTYARQLRQNYQGGSWQGENFQGKLNNISEEAAFTQPAAGIHSIAEILWHCIYWREVLIKRLEGDLHYHAGTTAKLNFLPLSDLKLKGWTFLVEELKNSQARIIQLLEEKNDYFLEQEYEPGYSVDYLIEGVIQHDIYHLGQIGLVVRLLKSSST